MTATENEPSSTDNNRYWEPYWPCSENTRFLDFRVEAIGDIKMCQMAIGFRNGMFHVMGTDTDMKDVEIAFHFDETCKVDMLVESLQQLRKWMATCDPIA